VNCPIQGAGYLTADVGEQKLQIIQTEEFTGPEGRVQPIPMPELGLRKVARNTHQHAVRSHTAQSPAELQGRQAVLGWDGLALGQAGVQGSSGSAIPTGEQRACES
jgi:hypothetical protein